MIKRRFYRFEHGSRDAPSESSSSSESEGEVEAADDSEIEEEDDEVEVGEDGADDDEDKEEEENVASDVREKGEASSSSGYESEDSSVNEVNLDSSGLPTSDEDVAAQNIRGSFPGSESSLPTIAQHSPEKDERNSNMAECILKRKSVFKCRLCPRIVCLSEETLKAHLSSKKHARSEKLHKEGRLKLMLNDDGEIESEMHSDDPDTTEEKSAKPNKKRKGRGKPGKRQRQMRKETELGKAKPSKGKREKRRKKDN